MLSINNSGSQLSASRSHKEKDLAYLASKTQHKLDLMMKAMNKRQINYFSTQQNKFMKTTNSEGGMRESVQAQSILQE